MSSTESDKEVLRQKNWSQQLRRKTSGLLNTLEARMCMRYTVVDRKSAVSSVKSSAKWALSICTVVH
jgi:hypothetical protein